MAPRLPCQSKNPPVSAGCKPVQHRQAGCRRRLARRDRRMPRALRRGQPRLDRPRMQADDQHRLRMACARPRSPPYAPAGSAPPWPPGSRTSRPARLSPMDPTRADRTARRASRSRGISRSACFITSAGPMAFTANCAAKRLGGQRAFSVFSGPCPSNIQRPRGDDDQIERPRPARPSHLRPIASSVTSSPSRRRDSPTTSPRDCKRRRPVPARSRPTPPPPMPAPARSLAFRRQIAPRFHPPMLSLPQISPPEAPPSQPRNASKHLPRQRRRAGPRWPPRRHRHEEIPFPSAKSPV